MGLSDCDVRVGLLCEGEFNILGFTDWDFLELLLKF